MGKGRSSGWQVTAQPKFTKPYCRPYKPNTKSLLCAGDMKRMFERSKELLKYLVTKLMICLPRCLLFKEERPKLESNLANMARLEEEILKKMEQEKREQEI